MHTSNHMNSSNTKQNKNKSLLLQHRGCRTGFWDWGEELGVKLRKLFSYLLQQILTKAEIVMDHDANKLVKDRILKENTNNRTSLYKTQEDKPCERKRMGDTSVR